MGKVTRRTLAKFLLKFTRSTHLIRKLYPLAINVDFPYVDPSKLLELGRVLRPQLGYQLVRYGSVNDGGYVMADMDLSDSILLSFGVGDNIDFENDLRNKVIAVEMFDHTVDCPPLEFPNVRFHKLGVAAHSSTNFVTIPDQLQKHPESSDFLLKIDIEGNEWDIFQNLDAEDLNKFSQIVGEFHGLQNFVTDPEFQEKVLSSLHRIKNSHNFIFIHANNWADVDLVGGFQLPDVIEFCAIRKNLQEQHGQTSINRVHSPNDPNANEIYLGFLSH